MPQGTLEQRKLKVRNIDANTVTVADLQVSGPDFMTLIFVWLETLFQVRASYHGQLRPEPPWAVPGLSHAHLPEGGQRCSRHQAVQQRAARRPRDEG